MTVCSRHLGIIGIYECAEIMRERFGNGRDIEGILLEFMNKEVRSVSGELGIAGNIEQIRENLSLRDLQMQTALSLAMKCLTSI